MSILEESQFPQQDDEDARARDLFQLTVARNRRKRSQYPYSKPFIARAQLCQAKQVLCSFCPSVCLSVCLSEQKLRKKTADQKST